MSRFSLTPEQQAVVEKRTGRVVVVAAAGSGKTSVLTERYVRHVVEDGFRPDQILTITFTNKAAANMKQRIVASLTEKGLLDEAQSAETGPIQTIHSFCQRLLRENALEAGLDPDFEISVANDAAVSEAIWYAVATADEDEFEREVVRQVAGRTAGPKSGAGAVLQNLIDSALHGLRGSGWPVGEVETAYRSPESVLELWTRNLLDATPDDVRARYLQEPSKDLSAGLIAAYKACGRAKPPYLKPMDGTEKDSAAYTVGLVSLACRAWRRLESAMLQSQALDFHLLESLAVKLLKESEPTRQRIARQVKVLLVDEAQDVNPTQYDLLSNTGIEVEMMVGDSQQSIYGFRQADVRLFEEKAARSEQLPLPKNFRSQPGILRFVDELFKAEWGESYRPMHEEGDVIDFQEMTERRFDGVEFWLNRELDTDLIAQRVASLVQDEGVAKRDICVLMRAGWSASNVLQSLTERRIPARLAGGSERYYTRMEVRDVANALQALSDPSDDFALLAVLRSPIVELTLDAVVLLAAQKPVAEAMRTVDLPNAEDREKLQRFRQWFEPLSEYADRLAAWEVIAEVFAKSPIFENLASRRSGRQRLANARKLLSLAASRPELGAAQFAEEVREIQRLQHKEGDAPADDEKEDLVTIMTVHKAKGLEWPVVVVPDLYRDMGKDSASLYDVQIDPRMGLAVAVLGGGRPLFHQWVKHLRKERDVEEEWRVLYVALTRAKSRLCLCLNPGGHGKRFSSMIPKAIGFKRDNPPPGIRVIEGDA